MLYNLGSMNTIKKSKLRLLTHIFLAGLVVGAYFLYNAATSSAAITDCLTVPGNLVQNCSFENPSILPAGYYSHSTGNVMFPAGYTGLTGWNIISPVKASNVGYFLPSFPAPSGTKAVDLSGFVDMYNLNMNGEQAGSGVEQIVSGLTIGQTYKLTFSQGYLAPFASEIAVSINGVSQGAFDVNAATAGTTNISGVVWKDQTITFTATSATAAIRFIHNIPQPGGKIVVYGSALDNVSLTLVPSIRPTPLQTPVTENLGMALTPSLASSSLVTPKSITMPVTEFTGQITTPAPIPVTVCSDLSLVSDTANQTAGFTETNPLNKNPLDPTNYGFGAWRNAVAVNLAPTGYTSLTKQNVWIDPITGSFAGSNAVWISDVFAAPGDANGEGTASKDQWRLFKKDFDIPAGAVVNPITIYFTADNAASVYFNGQEIGTTTPEVTTYGPVPNPLPAAFRKTYSATFTPTVGHNTLAFVLRNSGTPIRTNPTGLLYSAQGKYCVTTTSTTNPNTTPVPTPSTTNAIIQNVNIRSNNSNTSFATTGNVITLNYTLTEIPRGNKVTISGQPITPVCSGEAPAYQCSAAIIVTSDVPVDDGLVSFTITTTTTTRNTTTATTDGSSVTVGRTNTGGASVPPVTGTQVTTPASTATVLTGSCTTGIDVVIGGTGFVPQSGVEHCINGTYTFPVTVTGSPVFTVTQPTTQNNPNSGNTSSNTNTNGSTDPNTTILIQNLLGSPTPTTTTTFTTPAVSTANTTVYSPGADANTPVPNSVWGTPFTANGTPNKCIPYFTQYLITGDRDGHKGITEVSKIQDFLNKHLSISLRTDGVFESTTAQAVRNFQAKYIPSIIIPWEISGPTGWWYQSTRSYANYLTGCSEGVVRLDNGVKILDGQILSQ